MERLYSVPEVAKMLQVSIESVRRYIRAGKIRASKIGNGYRITEPDLKSFIDSQVKEDPNQ